MNIHRQCVPICKGHQYIPVKTHSVVTAWNNNSAGVLIGGNGIIC